MSRRKTTPDTPGRWAALRDRLLGALPAWAGGLAGAGAGDIPVRLSSRSYGRQRGVAVRETGFDQPLQP